MAARVFSFDQLAQADLVVDAVYEGAAGGLLSGEALSHVLPGIGNQGGFRVLGKGKNKRLVALFTSGADLDWPDTLNPVTGQFTYYGDNKRPGHDLHDTRPGGNKLLRQVFDALHSEPARRDEIPPFFVFEKSPTAVSSRSFQFRGLAVPGFEGRSSTEDLVAVWKTTNGQRFQNYRATFTILDASVIKRAWLEALSSGDFDSKLAPDAWQEWVTTGRRRALLAPQTHTIRGTSQQLPSTCEHEQILEKIWARFEDDPHGFEPFAARIYSMFEPRAQIDEVTRASVDGGRDAIGRLELGLPTDPVAAEFALEAKCYRPGLGDAKAVTVGVRDVARLISRIRHRQYGVLVTTSIVAKQAYEEVRADGHPIVFLAGRDVVEVLVKHGYNTPELVGEFLDREFPTH